jgi:hypothetical protein
MSVTLLAGNLQNHQEMEVKVSGPDGANRLFVIDGRAIANLAAGPGNQNQHETFKFLVGPQLAQGQFYRATAVAALADISMNGQAPPAGTQFNCRWSVDTADADWDDESGKIQVEVEVSLVDTLPNSWLTIGGFDYHISVLAKT